MASSRREYLALFGSFILIFLELFIRFATLGLRKSLSVYFVLWYNVDLNVIKLILSFDSSTTAPRASSTSSLLPRAGSRGQEESPWCRLSRILPISSTCVHFSGIMRKSISFRREMAICWASIGWVGGEEKRVYGSMREKAG